MAGSGDLSRGGRAAVWVGFYVICWLLMGLSCEIGLPPDCLRASEPVEVLLELPVLLAFALGQAVVCDILDASRFQGLVSKHYFPVVVILSGLAVSAFTRVEEFEDFQESERDFSTLQAVVSILLLIVVGILLLYHFWLAWNVLPGAVFISGRAGGAPPASSEPPAESYFIQYVLLCAAVVAHVALLASFAFDTGDSWGYHYILLAWVMSLVARFDDTLSVLWLALTTAVFLQGIGAYSLAFLSSES